MGLIVVMLILNLEHISSPFISGHFMDVKKADTLVYFATVRGFEIFNWNEANPQFIARFPTDGCALGLDLGGNYLFVADHYIGLNTIDISDPAHPSLIGNYDTDGRTYDVVVKDSIAYLADWENGLVIIDVSNPAAPFLLGHCPNIGTAYSITIDDTLVYLGGFGVGNTMKIINVSDPTDPQVIGEFPPPPDNHATDAFVEDTLAYVNCGYGMNIEFAVVDVKDPTNPKYVAGLPIPGGTNRGIEKVGDYVFTNAQFDGIDIIDVTDPTSPCVVGKYKGDFSFGSGFVVDDSFLVAPHNRNGFSIADISNPQKPFKIYHHENIGWCNFCCEDSLGYLYITGHLKYEGYHRYSILKIADIADPANPEICGELPFSGRAYIYEKSSDHPYLAVTVSRGEPGRDTLYTAVIDVSDPYNPEMIKFIEGGGVTEMYLPYLYALDGSKVRVGDINDPHLWIDSIMLPNDGYDLVVRDSIAYVTTASRSLIVLNIASGNIVGSNNHGKSYARNISLDFRYAAVPYTPGPGSTYGFLLFDVSNPSSPTVVIDTLIYEPPAFPEAICIMGCELRDTLLLWGRGDYGFDIWSINYPDTIYRILTQETPNLATAWYPSGNSNIHMVDSIIYLLDEGSLELYRFCGPGVEEKPTDISVPRLVVSPNPFSKTVDIRVKIGSVRSLTVDISLMAYDISGRLVWSRAFTSGYTTSPIVITWDGKDQSGKKLPQGVYFIRLNVKGGAYTEKVVLLR